MRAGNQIAARDLGQILDALLELPDRITIPALEFDEDIKRQIQIAFGGINLGLIAGDDAVFLKAPDPPPGRCRRQPNAFCHCFNARATVPNQLLDD